MKNFTEYLEKQFFLDYHGTKDQCEDVFDGWLENLQIDDLINHADLYAEVKVEEFKNNNKK